LKNLAVIPARGGSTRLKNKNIYSLGGKPLIRWSVESVLESGCFDTVIVSTDCDEIFDTVSDLKVVRHIRQAEHATTRATVLDAMMSLMKIYSGYDTFSYFLPTCPFISPEDIKRGMNMFDDCTDFVISMTEMQDIPQLACVMKRDDVIPVFDNLTSGLTNSKFIQKYHKPSGGFYMAKWDKLKETGNFFKGDVRGVIIPKDRSVDINDIHDIRLAEALIQGE
tara:strand:+ start:1898 stop:2566 length:669 start_codon:yes stop_codon:yes gene_type:complete